MTTTPEKKSEPILYSNGNKRPRRTHSVRKYVYIASAVLVLLLACYATQKQVKHLSETMGRPYPQLFANKTLEEVDDLQTVVRPLVDEDAKFDIIATVRVREWMARRKPAHPTGISGERVIFSNTIFKGLTLQDQHVHAKVNLSIPLGAFTEESLDNYDLRATFTLVPQSPSLIDYMSGSSTWYPSLDINKLIVQPESAQCHADRSLTKRQLATTFFSITIPLIEFNPIKSACGEDNGGPSWEPEDVATLHSQGLVSTKGRPPLQAHPYVVTRTDLRVVRMTELYDVRSYMILHRTLGLNATNPMSCPPRLFTKPTIEDLWNCRRSFPRLGNTEVAIKATAPDEKNGQNLTSLAYAPYMEAPYRSWGLLDLVPIPVKREKCPVEADLGVIKPYYKPLNVVWNVAFSASSPARLQVAHLLASELRYNLTDTEFNKAMQQMKNERLSAAGGHRFSLDNKMYLRWIIDETTGTLFRIARVLYVAYWMLLNSIEGVSLLGSALLSMSYILPIVSEVLPGLIHGSAASKPDLTFDLKARGAIALGIWKTLSQLRVSKSFPFVDRWRPTHRERETRRPERSSLGMGTLVLTLAAFSLTILDEIKPNTITILPRLGPAPETLPSAHATGYLWVVAEPILVGTLFVTGEILQLSRNNRSRKFVGRQKIVAYTVFVAMMLKNLVYLPWVLRGAALCEPLTVLGVVYTGIAFAWAAQAVMYTSVGQDNNE